MFSKFTAPANPPSNIEEAVKDLKHLLKEVGLEGFSIDSRESPQGKGILPGAMLEVSIPLPFLEKLLHKAASAAAAEHGVQLSRTALMLREAGENGLTGEVQVETKIFGGVVQIKVTGSLQIREQRHLQLSELKMEGGGGMFAGMAGAIIKPRLKQWEETTLDLGRLAGLPLTVPRLICDGNELQVTLAFE